MSLQHGPGSLRFKLACTNGQAAHKTVIDALPPSKDSSKRGVTKWGEKSCQRLGGSFSSHAVGMAAWGREGAANSPAGCGPAFWKGVR